MTLNGVTTTLCDSQAGSLEWTVQTTITDNLCLSENAAQTIRFLRAVYKFIYFILLTYKSYTAIL